VPSVVFYISGHGFGHAVRQIAIIDALHALEPDIPIFVRTSAPEWLFRRTTNAGFTLLPGVTDTGVVQIDSLHPDEAETVARALAFQRELPERVDGEVATLRRCGAGLVIADAPPLACAAAHAAGIPSVVCANFTWDWIYQAYVDQPGASRLTAGVGESYALAESGWRMPLHGGFETFGHVTDIPFVARQSRPGLAPHAIRATLGLPIDRRLALISFGGYGLRRLPLEQVDCLAAWDLVLSSTSDEAVRLPPGVHNVRDHSIYGQGLRYQDLVRAVDVVVTKPGYGIISDCLANGTAMLYTPRGRFPEYDVMVREMPNFLRSRKLELEDFEQGRWKEALDELAGAPAPPEQPATDGADVAARMISRRLSAL
jgi:hypothetical protein